MSTLFLKNHHWLVESLLLIVLGIAISSVEYILYRYYLPLARKKNKIWQAVLLSSIHWPFLFLVWFLIASFFLENLFPSQDEFGRLIISGRNLISLIFVFWFLMRFIRRWEMQSVRNANEGKRRFFHDPTSLHALAQVMRILAISIIVLMMMHSLGISISTLLAFGGIGGLAISFAAKDTLANFIGGLMIYWDRPFSVGDLIRSPDRNIEGTVTAIGWRLTTVQNPEKNPLYIPNGVFSCIVVENTSKTKSCRINSSLGIRYEDADKVPKIVQDITDMLNQHSGIDLSQKMSVRLAELGPSSLNILLNVHVKTADRIKFQEVKEDVLLRIIEIIAKNGAEFAYPTQTVHIPQGLEYFQDLENEFDDSRNLQ